MRALVCLPMCVAQCESSHFPIYPIQIHTIRFSIRYDAIAIRPISNGFDFTFRFVFGFLWLFLFVGFFWYVLDRSSSVSQVSRSFHHFTQAVYPEPQWSWQSGRLFLSAFFFGHNTLSLCCPMHRTINSGCSSKGNMYLGSIHTGIKIFDNSTKYCDFSQQRKRMVNHLPIRRRS